MLKSVEILRDNLRDHPAAQAWRAIEPERVEPGMIAVIKQWKNHYKSAIYRLAGVGPGGLAVIAKRCLVQTAAVERLIYEEFLPRLPLPTLGYYGSVDAPDGESCWLFLEEAGGDLYSPQNNAHRALAARWLAAVHNTGRHLDWETRLPDRGPKHYWQLLQSCRARVREHFTNPNLPVEGAAVLQTVAEQCDVLEEHWNELEETCHGMPRTLVHGDFGNKNVRVRPSARGLELLVFDWEFAGWGVPSTDLAQESRTISPDLGVYRSCLEGWPMMEDEGRIQQLAAYGRCFRLLDSMWWESFALRFGRPECLIEPIVCLKVFAERLARAFRAAGWRPYD